METTASIIAVLQLSDKVIKYIQGVSGATDDRKRLREQVRACSNILLTLRDGIEDSEEGQAWAETMGLLASPLARLQKALVLAALKLQARDGTKEKLKWPFKEKEVQKLIEAIESEKALLSLALENNSARLLHEINIRSKESKTHLAELITLLKAHVSDSRAETSDVQTAVAAIQHTQTSLQENLGRMRVAQSDRDLAKDRLDIIRWLSPIDHALQQHDKISRRQVGTCEWFLKSQSYQNWLNDERYNLFCPGIPGAGKTIVSSVVVADLWERCAKDHNIGAAYFFCEFGRQHEQTVDAVMLSLLKQLVESRTDPSGSILALYERFGHGSKRPLQEDVLDALRSEIASYTKVFILVDALDECLVTSELVSELFRLQEHANINLIATSRPIPEIQNLFRGKEWIEIHASDEDVRTYLDAQMRNTPKFAKFEQPLQAEVKTKIVQSVQGMYVSALPIFCKRTNLYAGSCWQSFTLIH
jgi:Cdc6-like AAA superfamily ATPase